MPCFQARHNKKTLILCRDILESQGRKTCLQAGAVQCVRTKHKSKKMLRKNGLVRKKYIGEVLPSKGLEEGVRVRDGKRFHWLFIHEEIIIMKTQREWYKRIQKAACLLSFSAEKLTPSLCFWARFTKASRQNVLPIAGMWGSAFGR